MGHDNHNAGLHFIRYSHNHAKDDYNSYDSAKYMHYTYTHEVLETNKNILKSLSQEECHSIWLKMLSSYGLRGIEQQYRGKTSCPICQRSLIEFICPFCGFTNKPIVPEFPELIANKPKSKTNKHKTKQRKSK